MNKFIKFLSRSAFTVALVFIFSTFGQAEAGGYIKLGDIKGESTDNEHKDWIIIQSMSSPLAATSGKRQHKPFSITKAVDKASPLIQRAAASGKVFPKVIIHMQASDYGGSRATYLKYELTNVMVTSVQAGGSAAGTVPMEEIALNYEEVKVVGATASDKVKEKPKRKSDR